MKSKGKTLLRWVVLLLAGLAALIAIFYAEENWRGKRAWKNFKCEWEAKGEKFDWQSVVPPPVPDDQNFALTPIVYSCYGQFLTRDGKSIPEEKQDTNFVNRLAMDIYGSTSLAYWDWQTNATGKWAKGTTSNLKSWQDCYRANFSKTNQIHVPPPMESPATDVMLVLEKYDSAIEELRSATVLPYSRYPVAYEQENKDKISLAHLASLENCSHILQLRALAELQNGQSKKAMDDVKLSLYLVNSVRSEPFMISQLFRAAMFQITLQPIYEGMAEHKWSDEQLAELERELAKYDFLADCKSFVRGQLDFDLDIIDGMRRFRDYRHSIFGFRAGSFLHEVGDHSKPWEDYTFNLNDYWRASLYHLAPSGWFYQNQVNCARTTLDFLLPLVDAYGHTVSPELSRRANAALKDHYEYWTFYNILVWMLLPSNAAAAQKLIYVQSSADLARTAVALERYRLAHSEYPETLAALSPQFIAQVPHDIIGGKPLHYRRTEDGKFVLYSVGWNETDDGGNIVLRKGGSVNTEKGDWVWKY